MSLDLENPETKTQIDELWSKREGELRNNLESEIKGKFSSELESVVKKKDELLSEAKKAKQDLSDFRSQFGSRSPEELKELAQKLENQELSKLVEDGDLDSYNRRITERLSVDYEAKLEAAQAERQSVEERLNQQNETIKQLRIDDVMKNYFIELDGEPGAIDDMLGRARRTWDLDEDNKIVARDGEDLIKGKNGLMTPEEWMQDVLKVNAQHLFKRPQGSGANGSGPNGSPTTKSKSTMTPDEKAAFINDFGAESYHLLPA